LVVEYSNLCPVYVNLKPLTVLAANEMANNIISLQNRKNHTSIACLREEDHLFIAMTYEACQIPCLLKIGYQTWYKEKCCNYTDSHIVDNSVVGNLASVCTLSRRNTGFTSEFDANAIFVSCTIS